MGILAKLLFGGGTDGDVDIRRLAKNGALLIDVRTPGEYLSGHIDQAINIPHNTITSEIGRHTKDKEDPIVLYCHSGMRSATAKRALLRAGYTNVVNGGSLHAMRNILEE